MVKRSALREAGVALHKAKSGRLIVKVSELLEPGSILFDDKGKKVGRVLEIIGPVRSPYASVDLQTDRVKKILGHRVYLREGR